VSGRKQEKPETVATIRVETGALALRPSGSVSVPAAAIVDQISRIADREAKLIDDVRRIYPAQDSGSPFNAAMNLVQAAVDRVNEARDKLHDDDFIAADDRMQHLQVLLPELFCFRDVSAGLGAVVTALLIAFRNLEGRPMDSNQVEAVGRALRGLLGEPFQTHEDVLSDIIKLEDAGLLVDPPELALLVEENASGVR